MLLLVINRIECRICFKTSYSSNLGNEGLICSAECTKSGCWGVGRNNCLDGQINQLSTNRQTDSTDFLNVSILVHANASTIDASTVQSILNPVPPLPIIENTNEPIPSHEIHPINKEVLGLQKQKLELSVKKEQIELEIAQIELEKQRELKNIDVDKAKQLATLEIEFKRKQLEREYNLND